MRSEMKQKLAPGLRVAKSRIDGLGCFAVIYFRQNQKMIAVAEAYRKRAAAGP